MPSSYILKLKSKFLQPKKMHFLKQSKTARPTNLRWIKQFWERRVCVCVPELKMKWWMVMSHEIDYANRVKTDICMLTCSLVKCLNHQSIERLIFITFAFVLEFIPMLFVYHLRRTWFGIPKKILFTWERIEPYHCVQVQVYISHIQRTKMKAI